MGEEEVLGDAGSRDEDICSGRRDHSCLGERGGSSPGVEAGRPLCRAGAV